MLKFYHNPRCRKSRAGLDYLKVKNIAYEIIDYLNDGLTNAELHEILLKTNLKPINLIRKQEDIFKKQFKGKSFTDEEWINIICENPKLLQRPIVVAKYKAIVGDPIEKIEELFK